jgi:small subunit ribosomal protein S19
MCRANWKGNFIAQSLLKNKSVKNLKVWSRSSVIPAFLVGQLIKIHNGKDFKRIFITREKVGFKFGAFALTRKITQKHKFKNLSGKKKK